MVFPRRREVSLLEGLTAVEALIAQLLLHALGEAQDYVVSRTRDALHLSRNTSFTHDVRRRVPWATFVSALQHLPVCECGAATLQALRLFL